MYNLRIHHHAIAAALALTLASAVPAAAQQPTTGPYVLGGLGLNWLQDSDVQGGAVNSKVDFDRGGAIVGALGYGLGNGFRLEGEIAGRRNDIDSVGGGAGDGKVTQWSLMGNVLYDFTTGTPFTPYIGAGLGGARVKVSDGRAFTGGRSISDSDTVLAYQGIAGIAYTIADNLKLDLGYRYFGTQDPGFRTNDGISVDAENRNHTVLLALRFEFGAPTPVMQPAAAPAPAPRSAQAAPAPAPAPAPAAPAIQRSYLVFFDWDKADITADAQRIIQQAAANARQGNVSRIQATGHADRSGTDRYNMALSQRRATAVRDALVRAGVPANQIAVIAKGEAEPLVPTADGVREPQNRRVEILLQ